MLRFIRRYFPRVAMAVASWPKCWRPVRGCSSFGKSIFGGLLFDALVLCVSFLCFLRGAPGFLYVSNARWRQKRGGSGDLCTLRDARRRQVCGGPDFFLVRGGPSCLCTLRVARRTKYVAIPAFFLVRFESQRHKRDGKRKKKTRLRMKSRPSLDSRPLRWIGALPKPGSPL